MQQAPLSSPVGALMRPTGAVYLEDSLGAAAVRLRENGTSFIPVLKGERLAGVVTETALIKALADGAQATDSLALAVEPAPKCARYTTGAEALDLMSGNGHDFLIVADLDGRIAGLLLPSDLFQQRRMPLRPPTIGGMATPFGVYLTTGSLGGGVGHLALMTTGMAMSAMFCVGTVAATFVQTFARSHGLPQELAASLVVPLAIAFFMLLMRLAPLSGIHAAEHMVVHAIERGEELTRETVRRMPRVHPRCGTNLAVGLSLFSGLFRTQFQASSDVDLSLIVAGIATLAFWRPLGSFVQYWVTTKPPTDKQIDLGIRAGKDLLDKYERARVAHVGFFRRLLNTGLFHVVAGATIAYFLVYGVLIHFGYGDFR